MLSQDIIYLIDISISGYLYSCNCHEPATQISEVILNRSAKILVFYCLSLRLLVISPLTGLSKADFISIWTAL